VPEGVRLSLHFDKDLYFLGENILAHLLVENVGQGVLYINIGGDYRMASRSLRFSVTATDERGELLPDPDPSGFCMGGISSTTRLVPDQKHYESIQLLLYRRFERPGVYQIRASHDFGWRGREGEPFPVAEATITLVMPNEAQARRIVEEMDQLPKDHGSTSGKRQKPFADFGTLIYPVYLPILASRAADGDERALYALGQMPTPKATRALVGLLNHPNAVFAREATLTLNGRLPDPQLEDKLPKRNFFDNDQKAHRRWLVQQAWRPEFAPKVRQKAHQLLASQEMKDLTCGAFILECLGGAEDVPPLIRALDRAVAKTRSLPKEEGIYPRPRGACQELVRAARMMAVRAVAVPPEPRSAGEAVTFATAVGTGPEFRPANWAGTYARLLRDESAYVREVAVNNLPIPVPAALVPLLGPLFIDPDLDVQIATCLLAEKARLPELRQPVLGVLASTRDELLLNTAHNAAYALATPLDRIRVLVARLDEDGMAAPCLTQLAGIILEGYSASSHPSREQLDVAAGRDCKAAWQKFLQEHGEAIAAGQRFTVLDGKLPLPDLFPRFTFFPNRNR
jgi:hypothetical protein